MARARNPLRKKAAAAKGAAKRGVSRYRVSLYSVAFTDRISLAAAAGQGAGAGATAPKRSNIVQMPDEYLPPNKILFIQNLPETITKEDLENMFKAYPNLHDVRLIPGRKGIAFVEYTDEASSTVAREALHNYKVDEEHKMKVGIACTPLSCRTCADGRCLISRSRMLSNKTSRHIKEGVYDEGGVPACINRSALYSMKSSQRAAEALRQASLKDADLATFLVFLLRSTSTHSS